MLERWCGVMMQVWYQQVTKLVSLKTANKSQFTDHFLASRCILIMWRKRKFDVFWLLWMFLGRYTCVWIEIIILFLVHKSRSTGAGDQINSLPGFYLGKPEVSQQLSSTWSFFLHLVQEWTENSDKNILLSFRPLLSFRQLFLFPERTWGLPLSSSVWVYSTVFH